MSRKLFGVFPVLVLAIVAALFLANQGFSKDYRPPNPVMDYVPQYIGIYDTYYGYNVADDCRGCHGDRDAGAKRHQFTASAFAGCPDGCPLSSPDCLSACHTDPDNPQSITDNCLTCHPASSYGGGGPHHETDLSDSNQCTACHQPDLLVETYSVKTPSYYPKANTPTPFACENCHWASGDTPNTPPPDWPKPIEATGFIASGILHPSKPYRPESETHMGGIYGNVYPQCYLCHANDPGDTSWDPTNPIIIRYCENCHSKKTLHGIDEHVTDGHGLTKNEKCVACHGEKPDAKAVSGDKSPVITGMTPSFGSGGTACIISGENFGISGNILLSPRIGETDQTHVISSGDCSWTDEVISFIIPGLNVRNYNVRVETQKGISNMRVFTVTGTKLCIPCPTLTPTINSIEPTIGASNALVTIYGQEFGDRHAEVRDVLLEKQGEPTNAASIYSWADSTIYSRIQAWYHTPGTVQITVETENGQSNQVDFELRDHPTLNSLDHPDTVNLTLIGSGGFGSDREYVRPDGYGWRSNVKLSRIDKKITIKPVNITSWSDTEIQLTLPKLRPDFYGVTVETKYFYDSDTSGGYNRGDKVYQTITSDPQLLRPDVIIQEFYTTDANENPTELFSPGEEIHYHFVYDVVGVGNVDTTYRVQKIVKVFSDGTQVDKASISESQTSGHYESVIVDNAPDLADDYEVKWFVNLKRKGTLFEKELRTNEISVQ